MVFVGKVFCCPLILLMTLALAWPSLSAADVEDEGHHQAFTAAITDDIITKLAWTGKNGDAAGLFDSIISLQAKSLRQAINSTERHPTGRQFRDYAASILRTQAADLKQFRDRHGQTPFSPLSPPASRSFHALATEVLSSFLEDTTGLRPDETAEDFIRFLVAYQVAIIDMEKIFLIFEEDYKLRAIVSHMLSQRQIEMKTLRKLQAKG